MLKVDDIQAIIDYCRVQGHSARKAAQVFRRARRTIARVLEEGVEGIRGRFRKRRAQVLLKEHRALIDDVLLGREGGLVWGKQKHNGLSITNLLREKLGYEGSVSQVRRYIQERRGSLGLLPKGEVTLDRLREATGLCEADWTEVKIVLDGAFITIWLFVMRFRFSGALFVRGYRAADAESLRDGFQRAFEWFGGVAPVVQLDNQKMAVAQLLTGRERRETKDYAAFRAHYGYRSQYTMRSSPDENGAVEATMGPVARWLTPVPQVVRMADLNVYLEGCCERYMSHQIRDRSGLVGENFADEKNLLIPLPPRRYDTARMDRCKVVDQSRFVYRKVWYSVPVAYRGRDVTVLGYAEEVAARCDGREIARHPRGFRDGERVLNPLHYLPVLRHKPHTLDHAEVFRRWDLPLVYERFREELARRSEGDGLREYVEILSLLSAFPQKSVTAALRRAAASRAFSAEAVRFFIRLQERADDAPVLEAKAHWGVPAGQLPDLDLTRYNSLAI